ncbi:MAG: DUF3842 family protein [Clostridia bacterium]|nr:DUF3842 family protein [Clostridia bacterium]
MVLCVLDGQGGGLGTAIAAGIADLREGHSLFCLGTNRAAAERMAAACGGTALWEKAAVLERISGADYILGTAGILNAGSMKGELTAEIASAVAASPAKKLILPMNRCGLYVAGVGNCPAAELIDCLCGALREALAREV